MKSLIQQQLVLQNKQEISIAYILPKNHPPSVPELQMNPYDEIREVLKRQFVEFSTNGGGGS